jgi:hypothetical protein
LRFVVIGGGCYGIYHSGQLYKAIQKGKLPPASQLVMVDRNAEPPARAKFGQLPNFTFVQADWHDYLMQFMRDPSRFDPARNGESVQIVPPPYAPHLFFEWLRAATAQALQERGLQNLQVEREGFNYPMHTPYEYIDPQNGNHFLSRAGWTCPATCIEPRLCPAVKDVRDWDLDADLRAFVAGQPVKPSVSAGPALEQAGLANGVGSPATAVLETPPPERFGGVETFKCHHFVYGIGTVPALRLYEARERLVRLALGLDEAHPETRVAVGTVSHCHGVVATILLKRTF